MRILGIETSCDETALSILECSGELSNPKFEIIDSVLLSQAKLHTPYGGVYPNLAKREHLKNLPILFEEMIKRHDMKEIDAIAVTQGPGLEPALWTGITFGKDLAEKYSKPLIPANHMEGHIISVLLGREAHINFPAIALLISGGHTQLVEVKSWGEYRVIGDTRDDAVGEAFDKVARIMGLPYPGGPEISKLAEEARSKKLEATNHPLPRPMLHSKDLDFSFSGLKTAVLYLVQKLGTLDETTKCLIAREFEDSVTEVIVTKTKKALEEIGANSLIVGGGVISNIHIRKELENLAESEGVSIYLPTTEASTDNALMIAAAGYISHLQNRTSETDFKAIGNLKL